MAEGCGGGICETLLEASAVPSRASASQLQVVLLMTKPKPRNGDTTSGIMYLGRGKKSQSGAVCS